MPWNKYAKYFSENCTKYKQKNYGGGISLKNKFFAYIFPAVFSITLIQGVSLSSAKGISLDSAIDCPYMVSCPGSDYLLSALNEKEAEKPTGKEMESLSGKLEDEKRIILIDPGHGGFDGGASSKGGTQEKDLNLQISLKLKSGLEAQGYKVIMTRDKDEALYDAGTKKGHKKESDLTNRNKLKKSSGCDMFISIHMNWFPQSKYYGAQIWYAKDDNSKKLADILQTNLKTDLDPDNAREEKLSTQYKILKGNDSIPSVIVECGFISNYEEEQKLKNETYQKKLADSIVKSVKNYYKMQKLPER